MDGEVITVDTPESIVAAAKAEFLKLVPAVDEKKLVVAGYQRDDWKACLSTPDGALWLRCKEGRVRQTDSA